MHKWHKIKRPKWRLEISAISRISFLLCAGHYLILNIQQNHLKISSCNSGQSMFFLVQKIKTINVLIQMKGTNSLAF